MYEYDEEAIAPQKTMFNDFPWDDDEDDLALGQGEQVDLEAPAAEYVAPDPFPTTEVFREGYGLVTEGRADINPAVHPGLQFDSEGDLLPPREWGA